MYDEKPLRKVFYQVCPHCHWESFESERSIDDLMCIYCPDCMMEDLEIESDYE